jgi:hypothetical protein
VIQVIRSNKPKLFFVRMSRDCALRTIESLARQLHTGSPNDGRYESFTVDGFDFSIAVHDDASMARVVADAASDGRNSDE